MKPDDPRLKNLKPFGKGKSGNPSGRNGGWWRSGLRRFLKEADFDLSKGTASRACLANGAHLPDPACTCTNKETVTRFRNLLFTTYRSAILGSSRAQEFLLEQALGKAPQYVEVASSNGVVGPVVMFLPPDGSDGSDDDRPDDTTAGETAQATPADGEPAPAQLALPASDGSDGE